MQGEASIPKKLGAGISGLAELLHDALPQTQCKRCTYPDCAGYALAMASGVADINQCPPGGAEGVARLAAILGRETKELNPAHGQEGPMMAATIDESWCIGCTLCLEVCPTDAIIGAHKRMHTVNRSHCTGCELCLPVCPVDCIQMEIISEDRTGWQAWSAEQAEQARQRYEARNLRLTVSARKPAPEHALVQTEQKQAFIEAALARVKAGR